jgi:hypothetical protein
VRAPSEGKKKKIGESSLKPLEEALRVRKALRHGSLSDLGLGATQCDVSKKVEPLTTDKRKKH